VIPLCQTPIREGANYLMDNIRSAQTGLALIEGLVAMLILVVAVLGMAGLAIHLMQQNDASKQRMNAALLADELLNVAILDTANVNCYVLPAASCSNAAAQLFVSNWLIEVSQNLPGNISPTVAINSNKVMTVSLFWKIPRDLVAHSYIASTQVGS
jgi:Tfp pilus assembly protein PilV